MVGKPIDQCEDGRGSRGPGDSSRRPVCLSFEHCHPRWPVSSNFKENQQNVKNATEDYRNHRNNLLSRFINIFVTELLFNPYHNIAWPFSFLSNKKQAFWENENCV